MNYKGVLCFLLVVFLGACGTGGNSEDTEVLFYRTTMDQQKLMFPDTLQTSNLSEIEGKIATIQIEPNVTYQSMDGFGFTLTGGSALHLQNMSAEKRSEILLELFGPGPEHLQISYLRVSIGSSDLDEFPWSYDDLPEGEVDPGLNSFSLAYDTLYLIPTMQEILKIHPELKIMGSPWSPPAWMKDNKDTRGGSLLPEFYATYAQYFVKYIKAMEERGINIDAVTIQNEPLHPGNNPSLYMPANEQATFIKSYLGPAFNENGITAKIIIYDHNADKPEYPLEILNDPEAAKFIDGSAFHLYGGSITALSQVHEAYPEKNLYFTEQWIGAPGNFAENFSWHTENLMIGAPNNWCKTVLQWNLAADENEEPHTDRGGCTRCLGAITIEGDKVTRNPAYYIVAQTSRFVPSGSVRIKSSKETNLGNVAYLTPDGTRVVLLQNLSNQSEKLVIKEGEREFFMEMETGEVGTLVLPK